MAQPQTSTSARQEMLMDFAQAFALLVTKMRTHGDAIAAIADLAFRAEQIASNAWSLGGERLSEGNRAAALERDLHAFIADAKRLAHDAARETAATREIVTVMQTQTEVLAAAAKTLEGVEDLTVIRATLRPIAAVILDLPERLKSGTALVGEVANLGSQAEALAARAVGLTEAGRNPAAAAIALYKGLREFAGTAGQVVTLMRSDSQTARLSVLALAARAAGIAALSKSPSTAPEASDALERIGATVDTAVRTYRPAVAPDNAVAWSPPPPS